MTVSAHPRIWPSLVRRRRGPGVPPPRQTRSAVSPADAAGGSAGTPGPYLTRSPGAAATCGSAGSAADCDSTSVGGCEGSPAASPRSEEHTSELQSPCNLVCRLLLEKKKNTL